MTLAEKYDMQANALKLSIQTLIHIPIAVQMIKKSAGKVNSTSANGVGKTGYLYTEKDVRLDSITLSIN